MPYVSVCLDRERANVSLCSNGENQVILKDGGEQ